MDLEQMLEQAGIQIEGGIEEWLDRMREVQKESPEEKKHIRRRAVRIAVPNDEELEEIASRESGTNDDTTDYFFCKAIASSDEYDTYYSRMGNSTLKNMRDALKLKIPILDSHKYGQLPVGRSVSGTLNRQKQVVAEFYVTRGLKLNSSGFSYQTTDDIERAIKTETVTDVSVGIIGGEDICDICGLDINNWFYSYIHDEPYCPHIPGIMYEDEDGNDVLATYTIEGAELIELSLVWAGANPSAEIIEKVRGLYTNCPDTPKLNEHIRAVERKYKCRVVEDQAGMQKPAPKAKAPKKKADETGKSEPNGKSKQKEHTNMDFEAGLKARLDAHRNVSLPDMPTDPTEAVDYLVSRLAKSQEELTARETEKLKAEADHTKALADKDAERATAVSEAEAKHEKGIEEINETHEAALAALKETHATELTEKETAHETALADKDTEITELTDARDTAVTEKETAETRVTELESEVEKLTPNATIGSEYVEGLIERGVAAGVKAKGSDEFDIDAFKDNARKITVKSLVDEIEKYEADAGIRFKGGRKVEPPEQEGDDPLDALPERPGLQKSLYA